MITEKRHRGFMPSLRRVVSFPPPLFPASRPSAPWQTPVPAWPQPRLCLPGHLRRDRVSRAGHGYDRAARRLFEFQIPGGGTHVLLQCADKLCDILRLFGHGLCRGILLAPPAPAILSARSIRPVQTIQRAFKRFAHGFRHNTVFGRSRQAAWRGGARFRPWPPASRR